MKIENSKHKGMSIDGRANFFIFETKMHHRDSPAQEITLLSDSQDSKKICFRQVFYGGTSFILEVKLSLSSFNHHIR